MSDEQRDDRQHRRPHPRAVAAPFLEFDLARELDQLQREPQPPNGQNAKTLAKYDDLRIVLIALEARARIPGHRAEGRVAVHTIRGHIRLRALERTFDLPPGSLLTLDQGVPHDVQALEDSAVLLTIAWPGREGGPRRNGSRDVTTGDSMDIELPTPSRQDMGGVTRRRTDDNLPMPNQNLSAGGSAH